MLYAKCQTEGNSSFLPPLWEPDSNFKQLMAAQQAAGDTAGGQHKGPITLGSKTQKALHEFILKKIYFTFLSKFIFDYFVWFIFLSFFL